MYHFYLRDVDVAPTPELRAAIHDIGKDRWQYEDRLSMRELMVILLLVAIGISLIVDSDKHIGIDSTTVTSLCAVVAVGIPQKLGNLVLAEHVVTWQLVLRRLPWELILVRLGGSALQVVAERSRVSTWLLETLLRHVNTRVHPAWCLVALMAATALVCEVDTGVAGSPLVHKLILLSERFQLHPLYFLLPVLMQSRCVLLVPYTSTPLAFLHLYAHMRSAELYWLGLLLKVIFCVAFVVAANTMLFL
ncbi:solute carrier family 13 member 2-like [Dermacentor andersoni]|uniref:solute carrier family 13 member 2-like n=1 Tax=Dermacentor andersoni TaxID=34620 RepID=UPI003B3B8B22